MTPDDLVLSIVVPCYARPEPLVRLLRELALQDEVTGVELVVVDDGSPQPLAPLVEAHRPILGFPAVCLWQANGGPSQARNTGARQARGRLLLFLDDDIAIAPGFLRAHLEAQERVGPAAISAIFEVEPASEDPELAAWYDERARVWAQGAASSGAEVAPGIRAVEGQLLSSTNACVPADAFWAVGGFDSRYRHPTCEDMDLGLRLSRYGLPVFRIATTAPRHLEPRTTLEQLCARQWSGARETVRLVRRFPEVFGQPELATVNGPLRFGGEPLALSMKKLAKTLLARPSLRGAVFASARALSRRKLPPVLLHRLYGAIVGAHIQAGWREGLIVHASTTPYEP